jgi:hypothetical protein
VTVIPISSEFVPPILAGTKVSTIRSGVREYPVGPAIMQSRVGQIPIHITAIVHKKLGELQEDDARRDGFSSLASLKSSLHRFYPSLSNEDLVTVIEFTKQ